MGLSIIFKVAKPVSVLPLIYSYATLFPTLLPMLSNIINGFLSLNLNYIGALLYVAGFILAINCLISLGSSKPTTYSSSILLLVISMLWLRLPFGFSDLALPIAGFITYLVVDTLALPFTTKHGGKGSLSRKTNTKGLLSYIPFVVFSASKYALPLIFGLVLYYVIEYALTYQIKASYGVTVFWYFITHEIVGKILVFLVIIGLGVYLLREISETLVFLSMREKHWAKSFVSQEKELYLKEFYGKTRLPYRATIAGFSAIIFYVVIVSVLRDLFGYLPITGFVASTVFSILLFLAISYVSWKIVDKIMFTITTEPTWKTVYLLMLITLAFLAYLELRFNYVTIFINTGEPIGLPIDSYAYETYFAFYSELIKIVRFISTVIGVVP